MVNAEDKEVRINRLTLLSKLRDLFLQVADISCCNNRLFCITKNLPQGRFFMAVGDSLAPLTLFGGQIYCKFPRSDSLYQKRG